MPMQDAKKSLIIGSLIIVLGFALTIFVAYKTGSQIGIGILGVGILVITLIGGNVLSKEHDLTSGEVRRAIAISTMVVFFGLIAFSDKISMDNQIIKSTIENFWWIVIVVIGFYFGGRSTETIINKWIDTKQAKNKKG